MGHLWQLSERDGCLFFVIFYEEIEQEAPLGAVLSHHRAYRSVHGGSIV